MKVKFIVLASVMFTATVCAQGNIDELAKPMEHDHKMVMIPSDAITPNLSMELFRDSKSGFNLHINTRHFSIEPPEFSGGEEKGVLDGHAHLFINGKKITRVYGSYVHLPEKLFRTGVNQVMVSLNNHQHDTWTQGGKMVLSTLVVDTRKEKYVLHQYSPFSTK